MVVLVALGALLGATGCGGGDDTKDKNAYVAAVNAAQERFAKSSELLQADISTATSTAAEDRRALDGLATAVRALVRELRGITPPGDVTALHAQLVKAVEGFGPVVRARRAVVDSSDPRKVIAARTRFSTGFGTVSDAVQAAIERINRKLTGG